MTERAATYPQKRKTAPAVWAGAVRHGYLVAVAVIGIAYAIGLVSGGIDAYAYAWMDRADPYGAAVGADGAFLYSPVVALANVPLSTLPWPVYAATLAVASLLALGWMAGKWALALLLVPAVALDILMGNVHLLLAAAIVGSVRFPALWAFPLLTKVTPGVGVLWYLFRREWRPFAVALGVTGVLALVSLALVPDWWVGWVETLRASAGGPPSMSIAIPLVVRLPIAVVLVWWGARDGRPALLPVAAYVAMPSLWGHSPAVLVGSLALWGVNRGCIPRRDSRRPMVAGRRFLRRAPRPQPGSRPLP